MNLAAPAVSAEPRAKPAIAHGDPLDPAAQPSDLSTGLAAGVALFPHGRFVFIGPDGEQAATYAETFARARHIVGGLRRAGVKPGDRVVLHFRDFADFVPALWGSLLAGAVVLPLSLNENSRYAASRAPELLYRLRQALNRPTIVGAPLAGSPSLALAALESGEASSDFHHGSLDDPRLLILSSGTTGAPNIVTLSARALIHRWWPSMPDPQHAATFLAWSPFDHVMGLGLAGPNLPAKVHLAPGAFVQSPASWLDVLERHRVTHATMTNFGMQLVERAASEAAATGKKWDLSSVAKIGVGAEAISPEVCARFLAALAPFGLRRDAVILGYGLSECGPVVGGGFSYKPGDGRNGLFPELDRPTRGHSVRILSPTGVLLREGEVGRIQVRGPTMTQGYWGDPVSTANLMSPDGWIRTGDLGFLSGGRLTVTGRDKEIIIIRAKKYACTEIEAVAASVEGVEAAWAAPTGLRDLRGGIAPGFGVFFITSAGDTDLGALARRLRSRIATHFGMAPNQLVPIGEDDVPRTATGKVQRLMFATRVTEGIYAPVLERVASLLAPAGGVTYASEAEAQIAAMWSDILGIGDPARDEDFYDLGGDSLAAESLLVAIEKGFGKRVPPELLRECTTVARLAAFVADAPPPVIAAAVAPAGGATTPQRNGIRFKRDAETLRWALDMAAYWAAPLNDLFFAAQYLVAYGYVDEAEAALTRVARELGPQRSKVLPILREFRAVNAIFRDAGIPEQLRGLGKFGDLLLSSNDEAALWQAPGSDKLLVVFNSMFGDFWVSAPVLHCLIRNLGATVLYLKDPNEGRYLDGMKVFGPGFDSVVTGIRNVAAKFGARDIRVMGFSSGAYAALLASAHLGTSSYLGLSIRPPEPPPGSGGKPLTAYVAEARALVLARGAPTSGDVYYGDEDTVDASIAREMSGLPGFTVNRLAGARHNTVLPLIAGGKFEAAVRRLLR